MAWDLREYITDAASKAAFILQSAGYKHCIWLKQQTHYDIPLALGPNGRCHVNKIRAIITAKSSLTQLWPSFS